MIENISVCEVKINFYKRQILPMLLQCEHYFQKKKKKKKRSTLSQQTLKTSSIQHQVYLNKKKIVIIK